MGIKGQGTKSIRKKALRNTRDVVGTKNIKIHHLASKDDSYIDITSLVTPTGLVNPSPSVLLTARLKDFSENFSLTSNLRPSWMEGLSYEIVSNTTIKLLNPALENEIFTGVLQSSPINGVLIADVRTPGDSGELLANQRDYNLGEAIPIKDLNNQWPIQVFRGSTGTPMLRNIGNATFVSDQTIGNYEMLDRGDGYCQVIRFNIAGDVGNEPVMWASHGALGERPNLSVLQRVDKLNGVIDRLRQDTLVGFGYDVSDPTRYDGGVPTQSDLKAFGDKVLALENILKNATVFASSDWIDAGPISITSHGTSPTKGTTTSDKLKWHREGDSMHVRMLYHQTTVGSDGSGTYLFSIPSGYLVDLSKLPNAQSNEQFIVGSGSASHDADVSGRFADIMFSNASNNSVYMRTRNESGDNYQYVGSTWYQIGYATAPTMVYMLDFKVPIIGWTDRVSLI